METSFRGRGLSSCLPPRPTPATVLPPIKQEDALRYGCTLPPVSQIMQQHVESDPWNFISRCIQSEFRVDGKTGCTSSQRKTPSSLLTSIPFEARDSNRMYDKSSISPSPTLSSLCRSSIYVSSSSSSSSSRSSSSSIRNHSPDLQTCSAGRNPREDRHEYDLEEQYAMTYLRTKSNTHWKDIAKQWRILFPPGKPRRPSAATPSGKTLPVRYPTRSPGALQCKYYRNRETLGMGAVRHCKRIRDGILSEPGGLNKLKRQLVEHWLQHLDSNGRLPFNLIQRRSEDKRRWLDRATEAYDVHSHFWTLLCRVT